MKINFLWGKTNVVSMYSWKHPELAIYDPNREEEEHWVAWKMQQALSDNNNETYKSLITQRPKPKGPFIPRII
tara:strand:- start:214 stop:432 length:219 start_codon:yes stop_codon:yes gene_type:complete